MVFTALVMFVMWLPGRTGYYTEKEVDCEGKTFTLASSSMMLCCSRTWSFRKATSCSSCAWSRSFKDFSFFSGGWELIFSLCNTPTEKSDHNISRWSKRRKHMRHADHLEVLLHQALDFLLHLLYSLSQLIIPFIQQFVLVQQGFALLLWLSNALQLVKRRHTLSLTSNQSIKTSTYRENSFFHTSSFLSSTSSELRSSNLRMVELSSAMRLWFLLMSWNIQVFNISDFHLHIHERTEEKPEPFLLKGMAEDSFPSRGRSPRLSPSSPLTGLPQCSAPSPALPGISLLGLPSPHSASLTRYNCSSRASFWSWSFCRTPVVDSNSFSRAKIVRSLDLISSTCDAGRRKQHLSTCCQAFT